MNARGRPSAWYFQRTRSSLFTLISITRRCLLFWGCGVASALQSSHADGGKITKKLLICIRPDSEGGGFWRTNGRSGCGSDFCLAAAASLAVDFPAENVTSVDGARINVEARLGHLKRETTEWPTAVTNSFNPPGRKKEPAVGISRLICRFSFIYTISTLKAFPVIESLHLPLERATPSLCGPGTFFSFFFLRQLEASCRAPPAAHFNFKFSKNTSAGLAIGRRICIFTAPFNANRHCPFP